MATSLSNSTTFDTNPYEGHPNLSELEAEVLWQYALLAQNVKEVRAFHHFPSVVATSEVSADLAFRCQLTAETRRLSEAPDETLLKRLRTLEMKMGLVLTLVSAISCGLITMAFMSSTCPSASSKRLFGR